MTDLKESGQSLGGDTREPAGTRRDYSPPSIEEEIALESVAMGCDAQTGCKVPGTS